MLNIMDALRARGVGVGSPLEGDAGPGDLRENKTAMNADGPFTGTAPVRAGGNVVPGAADIVKLAGIYDIPITVKAVAGLAANVIKDGANVGGVPGTFTSDATLAAADLANGKVGYGKLGARIVGASTKAYGPGDEIPVESFELSGAQPLLRTTFAGGGSGGQGAFISGNGIHVDRAKNRIIVFAYSGATIYALDTGAVITTVTTANATRYTGYDPVSGYVYFDSNGGSAGPTRVNIVDGVVNSGWTTPSAGQVVRVIGTGDGGCFLLTGFTLYKFGPTGSLIWQVAASNVGSGLDTNAPDHFHDAFIVDGAGNLYVLVYYNAVANNAYLCKLNSTGGRIASVLYANKSNSGSRMERDSGNNLYILTTYPNHETRKYNSNLSQLLWIDQVRTDHYDIQVDSSDNLYIHYNNAVETVKKFDPSGNLKWKLAVSSATSFRGGIMLEKNTTVVSDRLDFFVNLNNQAAWEFKQTVKLK